MRAAFDLGFKKTSDMVGWKKSSSWDLSKVAFIYWNGTECLQEIIQQETPFSLQNQLSSLGKIKLAITILIGQH